MVSLYYTRWWDPVTRTLAVLGFGCFVALVECCATGLQDEIANTLERYAAATVFVQAALLLILLFGLITAKWLRLRLGDRRESRRQEIEEVVVSIINEKVDAKRLERILGWHSDSAYVINRALQVVNGPARDRLEAFVCSGGLLPRMIEETLNRNPNRVIQAVTILGRLNNPEAKAAVERALHHQTAAVRVAGCRAVLARGSNEAQAQVLTELPGLPAWQRIVLFHLMPADSPPLLRFLQHALESQDDVLRLVALEFVLSQQRGLLLVCPGELASAKSLEVRIKFFRALPFLQVENDTASVLRSGLLDCDWRVRAIAAQACGYFRLIDVAPLLLRMCAADRNPVEAGHAARALVRLGGKAWERLQPLLSSGTEMVRRVAAEAVEKRMLRASIVATN